MMNRFLTIGLLLLTAAQLPAQRLPANLWESAPEPNPTRTKWVTGGGFGTYGLLMTGLGSLWYSQEDLGRFRFFNDAHEWKQIDKCGHMFSTYQASRMWMDAYQWAGHSRKKSILLGSAIGFGMVSSVEILDGFGETWGFSWPDIAANAAGAGFAVLNEALWDEPRLQLKLGLSPSPSRRDTSLYGLFGRSPIEHALKNYNLLTMWLSVRVHSFLPEGRFKQAYPRWLNVAVGYGAEGLQGGYDDPTSGWQTREYRQLYLSLDFDLSQIRTQSPFLQGLFRLIGIVKIPFPVLRYDRNGWGVGSWG